MKHARSLLLLLFFCGAGCSGLPPSGTASPESSWGTRLLWLLPDRFLDLADIVSFRADVAVGSILEVHVTRWMGFGAGARVGVALLWFHNRNLGASPFFTGVASFGPYQAYLTGYYGGGTGWNRGRRGSGERLFTKSGKFSVHDKMVQDGWTDPFGIGFGHIAEVHPVEIADFLVGTLTLGLIDLSRDDFANPQRRTPKTGLPGVQPAGSDPGGGDT